VKTDLRTRYLGLELPHPLVVGASPLCDHLDRVREMEDHGVAALVMHSLFEEQILQEQLAADTFVHGHEETFAEATSYFPGGADFALTAENYLGQIEKIRARVSFPVIASLNGRTPSGWVDYARDMEGVGADALELNLYFQPTPEERPADAIEKEAVDIVRSVCARVGIPVAVKLSPYFSSLPHFVRRLEEAGAAGVVLFNRFYQPDIDIEEWRTQPHLQLSESAELLLRLRWLAILHGRYELDLACSGGVHTGEDAVKALMSGAACVQMVSSVLRHGVGHVATVLTALDEWMAAHEYGSLAELVGSMSYANTPNPEAVERANYVRLLTDAQVQDRFGPVAW